MTAGDSGRRHGRALSAEAEGKCDSRSRQPSVDGPSTTRAADAVLAGCATVRDFPDGPPDETGLTPRQRRVLEVIRAAVERRGYPPSVREIGEAVGLTSTSSVAHQLKVLQTKGFLRRDPNRPRAVEVLLPARPGRRASTVTEDGISSRPPAGVRAGGGPHRRRRPRAGRGGDRRRLPAPAKLCRRGHAVPAQVTGDSMIEAAICDGDWVVVRQQPVADNGDIVAAMIDGEATVKTFSAQERPRAAAATQPGLRAHPRRRGDDPRAASSPSCAGSDGALNPLRVDRAEQV